MPSEVLNKEAILSVLHDGMAAMRFDLKQSLASFSEAERVGALKNPVEIDRALTALGLEPYSIQGFMERMAIRHFLLTLLRETLISVDAAGRPHVL